MTPAAPAVPAWRGPPHTAGRLWLEALCSLPASVAPTGLLLAAGLTLAGCADAQDGLHNTLTDAERGAGWELLFDGRTLEGWRGYNRPDMPEGWAVEDGTLAWVSAAGDIITERQFTDFELTLDWKVDRGGNSGVFYRAAEGEDWIYQSAPELQVLDDEGHVDGESPLTSAGSNFALHGAPRGVVRPAGEWNSVRVVVDGSHVEHWLNGTRVVQYELGSTEWEALVGASKFAAWPAYGRAPTGHIGLQDHGNPVWFRNVKIRELP